MIQDLPDKSTTKISWNIDKSPRDLGRLSVTQTSLKNQMLKLALKPHE